MTPPDAFVSSLITLPDGTSLLQLPAYVEAQYTDIDGLRTMASPEVFFCIRLGILYAGSLLEPYGTLASCMGCMDWNELFL
jgi:hypothetical protein